MLSTTVKGELNELICAGPASWICDKYNLTDSLSLPLPQKGLVLRVSCPACPHDHLEICNDFILQFVFCKWNPRGQPLITSIAFWDGEAASRLNSEQYTGRTTWLETRVRSPGKLGQRGKQRAGQEPVCSKRAVSAQTVLLALARKTVDPDRITKGSALPSPLSMFVVPGFLVDAFRWSSNCGAKKLSLI